MGNGVHKFLRSEDKVGDQQVDAGVEAAERGGFGKEDHRNGIPGDDVIHQVEKLEVGKNQGHQRQEDRGSGPVVAEPSQ